MRQTDWGGWRQDRLLYWPITSSLDHSMLCYLQDPLSTSSTSQTGLPNQMPGIGHRPQQTGVLSDCKLALTLLSLTPTLSTGGCPNGSSNPQRGALTDCKWLSLRPSLPPTDSTAMGICIYYFITPTYFRLDHMIFFHLFTQVRFWLTAQSRVNM